MLAETASLHDIRDIEGFVASTLARSGLRLPPTEHEELLAEGLTLLYEIEREYEPRRNGHATPGRFSGFAARRLPQRLGDAWHRWHPEHCRVSDNGTRRWRYEDPPLALADVELVVMPLEALAQDDGRIDEALALFEPWQRIGMRRMLSLVADGYGWNEIATELGVTRPQLSGMREQLRSALTRLDELDGADRRCT